MSLGPNFRSCCVISKEHGVRRELAERRSNTDLPGVGVKHFITQIQSSVEIFKAADTDANSLVMQISLRVKNHQHFSLAVSLFGEKNEMQVYY